jgi:hypothetical protein
VVLKAIFKTTLCFLKVAGFNKKFIANNLLCVFVCKSFTFFDRLVIIILLSYLLASGFYNLIKGYDKGQRLLTLLLRELSFGARKQGR